MVSDRLGGGGGEGWFHCLTSRLFLPVCYPITHWSAASSTASKIIMAIANFLAASDITSAINACKGQEAVVFLTSVQKYIFKRESIYFKRIHGGLTIACYLK